MAGIADFSLLCKVFALFKHPPTTVTDRGQRGLSKPVRLHFAAPRPASGNHPAGSQSASHRCGFPTVAATDLGQFVRLSLSLVMTAAVLSGASGCRWAANGQNAVGARMYEQGQYSAALQQFQKVIAADPMNADGYYNLAASKHQLGNQRGDLELLNQAESLYNQCLDHDPNHVECHRGLAVLLVDTNRPDRAFALLKNWAARNPDFSEPYVELARLYEEANQPETALLYLEEAVGKDTNNARAWLALASLRERAGDLVQAQQNYQQSLAINRNQPLVAARVAALSQQIAANAQATASANQTQIAAPAGFQNRWR